MSDGLAGADVLAADSRADAVRAMTGKILAFCVAGAAAVGPACASAETLRANYTLSLMGLTIGNAYAAANLDPAAYKIDLSVKLTGLAAMVAKTRGAATASGAIANAAVLPAGYANTTANASETRTVRMGLNGGTVRAVDISPPFFDMEGRVPVTEAHKQAVVDPVSALIMTVPNGQPLVGPTACNRTIPVYDGLVRFNVTLAYAGMKAVQGKGYSGPVSVCTARYTPVAGYKLDSKSTKFMADNRNMEVWLAPIESSRIVAPWYISIGTMTGTLVIKASEFSLSGQSAQR